MSQGPQSPASLEGSSWYASRPWEGFVNDGSSTASAFGLLRITRIEVKDGDLLYHVDQPDNDCVCGNLIAVNGPVDVPSGGYGDLLTIDHGPFVIKLQSGSPVFGNLVGAKANQWLPDTTRAGFTVIGDLTNAGQTLAMVIAGPFTLRGKQTGSSWNVDTNADVAIWQGRDTGAVTSPAVTVNVRNRLANITAAGDAVISWEGSQWALHSYRCPGI